MAQNITYRDLLRKLMKLSEDQLDMDVAVYIATFDKGFSGNLIDTAGNLDREFNIDICDLYELNSPVIIAGIER